MYKLVVKCNSLIIFNKKHQWR